MVNRQKTKENKELDDFHYADDISSTKEQLKNKFNDVNRYVHTTGLKINTSKAKIMR
jgi:hypothetical protein